MREFMEGVVNIVDGRMTYDVVSSVRHYYDIPDDAIAVIHYESTYEHDDILGGALKETDNNLHIFKGGEWKWTIWKDLNDLKRQSNSYIIWEKKNEEII